MRLGLVAASATALLLSACGEPRQVGDVHVQGDVATYDYYAEFRETTASGKQRIYLLTDPATVAAFAAGSREVPLSKTFIAAGPEKETIQVEVVKDPDVSRLMVRRVIAAFNAKNNASVTVKAL